jgi:hypothetical protein
LSGFVDFFYSLQDTFGPVEKSPCSDPLIESMLESIVRVLLGKHGWLDVTVAKPYSIWWHKVDANLRCDNLVRWGVGKTSGTPH